MALQTALFERGQAAGVIRDGDPAVLGRLFSGLISSYQQMDPLVMSDDPGASERLALRDLHEVITKAFGT
jgi:hypothetical protein